MTIRKLLLGTIAATLLAATPAVAFYTECSITKETALATRPNGPTEPRYMIVNKGDKVAFRQSYRGWWFVLHWDGVQGGQVDYGWIPLSVLINCQPKEGTP